MRIQYAMSMWNFTHYADNISLERLAALIREMGWGVEFWVHWQDEHCLFDEMGRKRLKAATEGMPLSLHGAGEPAWEHHKMQIDAAAFCDARLIVVHAVHFMPPGSAKGDIQKVDVDLIERTVEYAQSKGVMICLENTAYELAPFVSIFEKVKGLKFCLDTGHVYNSPHSMAEILDALGPRLVHLHLEDIILPAEDGIPLAKNGHFTPGTGGIPLDDWQLLRSTLMEVDYDGIGVFEIRPRNPFQTVKMGEDFFENLMSG